MPQIPVSLNFSAALHLTGRSNASLSLSAPRIKETGSLYTALLRDLDQLLATDPAFLLGSWLAEARKLGGNATDCTDTVLGDKLSKCADFMEWNARAQLTTWHPVDSPSHPTPNPEGSGHEPWPGHIDVSTATVGLGLTVAALTSTVAANRTTRGSSGPGWSAITTCLASSSTSSRVSRMRTLDGKPQTNACLISAHKTRIVKTRIRL